MVLESNRRRLSNVVGGELFRHGEACRGAGLAGLGAGLAMRGFVLGALVAAGLADFGAQCAHGLRVGAVAGQEACGQVAHGSAIGIQGDALGHHLEVVFLEARCEAGVALDSTCVAGFDTGCVGFTGHG